MRGLHWLALFASLSLTIGQLSYEDVFSVRDFVFESAIDARFEPGITTGEFDPTLYPRVKAVGKASPKAAPKATTKPRKPASKASSPRGAAKQPPSKAAAKAPLPKRAGGPAPKAGLKLPSPPKLAAKRLPSRPSAARPALKTSAKVLGSKATSRSTTTRGVKRAPSKPPLRQPPARASPLKRPKRTIHKAASQPAPKTPSKRLSPKTSAAHSSPKRAAKKSLKPSIRQTAKTSVKKPTSNTLASRVSANPAPEILRLKAGSKKPTRQAAAKRAPVKGSSQRPSSKAAIRSAPKPTSRSAPKSPSKGPPAQSAARPSVERTARRSSPNVYAQSKIVGTARTQPKSGARISGAKGGTRSPRRTTAKSVVLSSRPSRSGTFRTSTPQTKLQGRTKSLKSAAQKSPARLGIVCNRSGSPNRPAKPVSNSQRLARPGGNPRTSKVSIVSNAIPGARTARARSPAKASSRSSKLAQGRVGSTPSTQPSKHNTLTPKTGGRDKRGKASSVRRLGDMAGVRLTRAGPRKGSQTLRPDARPTQSSRVGTTNGSAKRSKLGQSTTGLPRAASVSQTTGRKDTQPEAGGRGPRQRRNRQNEVQSTSAKSRPSPRQSAKNAVRYQGKAGLPQSPTRRRRVPRRNGRGEALPKGPKSGARSPKGTAIPDNSVARLGGRPAAGSTKRSQRSVKGQPQSTMRSGRDRKGGSLTRKPPSRTTSQQVSRGAGPEMRQRRLGTTTPSLKKQAPSKEPVGGKQSSQRPRHSQAKWITGKAGLAACSIRSSAKLGPRSECGDALMAMGGFSSDEEKAAQSEDEKRTKRREAKEAQQQLKAERLANKVTLPPVTHREEGGRANDPPKPAPNFPPQHKADAEAKLAKTQNLPADDARFALAEDSAYVTGKDVKIAIKNAHLHGSQGSQAYEDRKIFENQQTKPTKSGASSNKAPVLANMHGIGIEFPVLSPNDKKIDGAGTETPVHYTEDGWHGGGSSHKGRYRAVMTEETDGTGAPTGNYKFEGVIAHKQSSDKSNPSYNDHFEAKPMR